MRRRIRLLKPTPSPSTANICRTARRPPNIIFESRERHTVASYVRELIRHKHTELSKAWRPRPTPPQLKYPIDILTRSHRVVDQSTIPHDKTTAHQSVRDLTFELSALVDRIASPGANVLTSVQIRAVKVDNRQ